MAKAGPARLEVIAVHLLTWWGIRILTSQTALLQQWEPHTSGWWLIRLGRAAAALAVIGAWASFRAVPARDLGLGGRSFWKSTLSGFAVVTVLWFGIAVLRGKGLAPSAALPERERVLMFITSGVDVVAQQLPTFGLLPGLLGPSWWVLALTWLSFTTAHVVGASVGVVLMSGVLGAIFLLLRRSTGNLGAGMGAHFAYYAWLAILGWGIGGR